MPNILFLEAYKGDALLSTYPIILDLLKSNSVEITYLSERLDQEVVSELPSNFSYKDKPLFPYKVNVEYDLIDKSLNHIKDIPQDIINVMLEFLSNIKREDYGLLYAPVGLSSPLSLLLSQYVYVFKKRYDLKNMPVVFYRDNHLIIDHQKDWLESYHGSNLAPIEDTELHNLFPDGRASKSSSTTYLFLNNFDMDLGV